MKKELIGGCGIYCGACDHYVSNQPYGKHLLEQGTELSEKLLQHPCGGCKNETLEHICVYCRDCVIRLCTIEKGVDLCIQCEAFPCKEIYKFKGNFLEHKKTAYRVLMKSKGVPMDEWLKLRRARWTCPECGSLYSFYETKCHTCGNQLRGLEPDRR